MQRMASLRRQQFAELLLRLLSRAGRPLAILSLLSLPCHAEPVPILIAFQSGEAGGGARVRDELQKRVTAQFRLLPNLQATVLSPNSPRIKDALAEGKLSQTDIEPSPDSAKLRKLATALGFGGALFISVDRVQTIDDVDLSLDCSVSVSGLSGEDTFAIHARASKYEAKYAEGIQRRTVYDITSQSVVTELKARASLWPSKTSEALPEKIPARDKSATSDTISAAVTTGGVESLEPGDALRNLARASAASPRDPSLYVAAGDIYLKKGKIDYAVLEYKRAVYVDPKNRPALLKLTQAYASRGQPWNTLDSSDRMISAGYDGPEVRYLMAQAHLAIQAVHEGNGRLQPAREELDKAIVDFQKAADFDRDNVGLHTDYGKELLKAERYREAALVHKRVTELAPTDPSAWQSLALSLLGVEDYRGGVESLTRSVDLRPTRPVPLTAEIYPKILRLTDGRAREIYLQARADISDYGDGKIPAETLLRRAQKQLESAEKLAELMPNIDPPVGKQKSHLQRTLSYQLVNQSMVALVSFAETNDESYRAKATLLLTEFANEYEATRQRPEPPAQEQAKGN